MQVSGLGIDIVEISRIKKSIDKYGDRFKRRVFTEKEIAYCERYRYSHENYASRFAAKEALLKALGTGKSRGIAWTDIEVVRLPGKAPEMVLHGRAAEIARELGVKSIKVALTHEREIAQATVIVQS